MKLIRKLLTLALMIIAPIISGRAFYEYFRVTVLGNKPSYPFGKALMSTIHSNSISYLSDYSHELLTIGVVFLIITVIAYLSMMIRALMNMIWLGLLMAVVFMIYKLLG